MKIVYGILVAVLLIGAVSGIFWSGMHDFGQRQSVEFFPYSDEIELDDGTVLRSSGVMIRVNVYESAPTDQVMATLMVAAKKLYPDECSGENFEIAVRRPNPDGGEEKYSYSFSIYEVEGPASWIEYGSWKDDLYVVREAYKADWSEIDNIAHGISTFQIRIENADS